MKVEDVQSLSGIRDLNPVKSGQEKATGGTGFEEFLTDSIKQVNNLQLQGNQAVQELAVGKSENIHETMIAMEKATISFQMMMQIRNKIIDAYQDILKTSM